MTSGRFALLMLVCFLAFVLLQISGVAAELNASIYQTVSNYSGAKDGFLIRRVAARVTSLGDTSFCVAMVCLVLFWGWSARCLNIALGFTFGMVAVVVLNTTLKLAIATPRPESGAWMTSFSFPSAHASVGLALWGMLAAIAVMGIRRTRLKLVFAGLLLTVGFAVAVSRVIIGVHWPIDVVAGALEGLLVATVFYRFVYRDKVAPVKAHDPQLLLSMVVAMSAIVLFF